MTDKETQLLEAAREYAAAARAVEEHGAANPSPRYREIKDAHDRLIGKRGRALYALQNACDALLPEKR